MTGVGGRVNRSLAGSAGKLSMWWAEEDAPHPDSRSTVGSQDDRDSADPAPTELCTDALQQPANQAAQFSHVTHPVM